MLLENLPKSASLPVATSQETKRRIIAGVWDFDYIFYTESDQVGRMWCVIVVKSECVKIECVMSECDSSSNERNIENERCEIERHHQQNLCIFSLLCVDALAYVRIRNVST